MYIYKYKCTYVYVCVCGIHFTMFELKEPISSCELGTQTFLLKLSTNHFAHVCQINLNFNTFTLSPYVVSSQGRKQDDYFL